MPGGYVGGRPKDKSKLSVEPHQIRNRLRRRGTNVAEDIALYEEHVWKKKISEWDYQELAHGRPRNVNGNFQGVSPKWCTAAVQAEAKKRLLNITKGSLVGHLEAAIGMVGKLITSEEVDEKGKPIVDAKTKLAAAQFIIEHVIGKATAVVEVSTDDAVRSAIAAAIVLDDGLPQGHIIEGEFEEEDEEDDDSGSE